MRAECIASHLGLTKHGSDGAGGTMHGRRAPADAAWHREDGVDLEVDVDTRSDGKVCALRREMGAP